MKQKIRQILTTLLATTLTFLTIILAGDIRAVAQTGEFKLLYGVDPNGVPLICTSTNCLTPYFPCGCPKLLVIERSFNLKEWVPVCTNQVFSCGYQLKAYAFSIISNAVFYRVLTRTNSTLLLAVGDANLNWVWSGDTPVFWQVMGSSNGVDWIKMNYPYGDDYAGDDCFGPMVLGGYNLYLVGIGYDEYENEIEVTPRSNILPAVKLSISGTILSWTYAGTAPQFWQIEVSQDYGDWTIVDTNAVSPSDLAGKIGSGYQLRIVGREQNAYQSFSQVTLFSNVVDF
jgi:hypothetical protein